MFGRCSVGKRQYFFVENGGGFPPSTLGTACPKDIKAHCTSKSKLDGKEKVIQSSMHSAHTNFKEDKIHCIT